MQRLTITCLIGLGFLASQAQAQVTVTPGPSADPWIAFMNVSELPANGGGFVFGSGWGVPDLAVSFDDANNKLTFQPNSINDTDPFWYIGGGGPGQAGNKIMEANLFVQVTDTYGGQTVTFEGNVLSDTTTAAHSGNIFIRDFAPDFSSFNETIVPLTPGAFSISLATDPGAGRHVQYGFQMVGENVWITDVAPFGNFMIQTPEPTSLLLLSLAGLLIRRR